MFGWFAEGATLPGGALIGTLPAQAVAGQIPSATTAVNAGGVKKRAMPEVLSFERTPGTVHPRAPADISSR